MGTLKKRTPTVHPKPRTIPEGHRELHSTVYDWETIRQEFIEGIPKSDTRDERTWLNLKEMSERHDVPYLRIRKRSSTERWTERRQAAQDVATLERAKERAKKIAKNSLDFDEKALDIAKTGLALVHARMAELGQDLNANKALRADALARKQSGLPYKQKELWASVRYSEIQGLASAAELYQSLGMKAMGTDVQRIDIEGQLTGGGDVTINVTQEMQRDDPDRLATMLGAMNQAGLVPDEVMAQLNAGDDDVLDAEIVEGELDDDGAQGIAGDDHGQGGE